MDQEKLEPAGQRVDLRAATHAAVLRAIDPALDSVMENILKNWQQTIERRRA
jgi:hypothetical protein